MKNLPLYLQDRPGAEWGPFWVEGDGSEDEYGWRIMYKDGLDDSWTLVDGLVKDDADTIAVLLNNQTPIGKILGAAMRWLEHQNHAELKRVLEVEDRCIRI